jgi:hypothetical protein
MILGLSGRAGAGKDLTYKLLVELADQLVSRGGRMSVVRRAFADPLKVSAARALGVKGDAQACLDFCNRIKGDGLIRVNSASGDHITYLTGREYLQFYGTEAHREVFDDSFWVDASLPKGWNPVSELVVVTDVRFPNEAERIHENGGVVWQINRPDGGKIAESAHSSEVGLHRRYIHRYIDNDGTVDDLRGKISDALLQFDNDVNSDVPCGCA